MAAITETGNKTIHAATASTTAETWALQQKCNSLRITNRDADPIFVTIVATSTAVTDDSQVTITTAVADADETYIIPGVLTSGSYQTREIWRSPRAKFLCGSIVGNVSTYDIEGFDWY